MKSKRGVLAVLVVFGVLVSMALSGCGGNGDDSAAQDDAIRIGIAGPMTFIHGEHMWKSATMAAEEINAAGGVQVGDVKRPIELVSVETNEILNVPDAANAIERAITVDNVDFLLGGFRTEAVLGMQDVAADHETIFIITGSGHPQLTTRVGEDYEKYKYFFRTNPMNSNNMARASFLILHEVATVVREDLGFAQPKVAILAESAIWVDPIIEASEAQMPEMGLEIVGVWRPSANATDLSAELSAISASGAHIIFTVMSGPVGGPFARQYEELQVPAAVAGINVDAMGGKFWETTGGLGAYVSTLNLVGRVETSPHSIDFFDRFMDRYEEIPVYTVATYDALNILVSAIEEAGTTENEAVIAALQETDAPALGGRVVFTDEHDVTWGPGYVTGLGTQWQDGELKVFWPNDWEGIKYEGTVRYELAPWVVDFWQ